jgi:hypothetical protein
VHRGMDVVRVKSSPPPAESGRVVVIPMPHLAAT